MTVVRLPEWLPDLPAHQNPGLTVCKNVIPASGGHYEPVPILQDVIAGNPAPPTINSPPKGAFTGRDADNNVTVFVGYSTKISAISAGSSSFEDVTRASGAYQDIAPFGNWRFTQMGQRVIATNFLDDVQSFTLGSSTDFDDLSADAPRAKCAAVWSPGFLVLGHLDTDPQGVHWSAIGDPTSFPAVGSSAAKEVQSDEDTMEGEYGVLTNLTGAVANADGLVFLERGIFRAEYRGPGVVFSILPIEGARGCPVPNSVIHYGAGAAYWSGDGFYVTDGATSIPIGDGKVDAFFRDDLDTDQLDRVSSCYDPERKLFLWNYISVEDNLFRTLVYNWATKRWALWCKVEDTANLPHWIFTSSTLGYTVDTADNSGISIETTSISPDDRFWAGGPPVLACFFKSSVVISNYFARFGMFTGSNRAVEIETGELDLGEGRRVTIQGIRPFVDTLSVSCSVGYRDTQADSVTYTTAAEPAADGECKQRINTRYARAKIEIDAAVSWSKLWAYEPRFVPGGYR
jgi:hypothetical protein